MKYSQATEQTNSFLIRNNTESYFAPGKSAWRFAGRSFASSLILFLLVTFLNACAAGKGSGSETENTKTSTAAPALPSPSPVSRKIDPTIAHALDALLNRSEYQTGRWGVAVMSLADGKLIYDHNGNSLFTPASNMKLYTTAVALDLLGADYRWRTSVYATTEPDASGTIGGDLILYGRGAPDLLSANVKENANSLAELALALRKRGITQVRGNVIGDESYFRGDPIGTGWQWNDLQWYFGAEASALTVNGNTVDVNLTPPKDIHDKPKVVSSDKEDYVQIANNVAAVERGGPFELGVQRGLSDNKVTLWGEMPLNSNGLGVRLSVHQPAAWAARLFLSALKANSVTVDGKAFSRDSRVPENQRFDSSGKPELAAIFSLPLSAIIKETNKESLNLYAELLLRTLGRERSAMLPNPAPRGRERGDEESGTDLISLWLNRSGINTSGMAIHDGSGLSRLNLVTPSATAQLLYVIRQRTGGQIFLDSLPISGTDGTLSGRLQSVRGRVAAKTGTLTYDHSLSGYVVTTDGQNLAFSIMSNDLASEKLTPRLIDDLVTTIAESHVNAPHSPKAK